MRAKGINHCRTSLCLSDTRCSPTSNPQKPHTTVAGAQGAPQSWQRIPKDSLSNL